MSNLACRKSRSSRLLYVLAFLAGAFFGDQPSYGQDDRSTTERRRAANSTSPGQVQTPQVAEVPEAPRELKGLLEDAKVRFRFGGIRPSLKNRTRSTGGPASQFDAETQFNLQYHFSSRCRSNWTREGGKPILEIRVRFDSLKMVMDHEVWFRDRPFDDDFWQSALVLHEMDHVRLSSDPELQRRFKVAVMKHQTVRLTVDEAASRGRKALAPGSRISSEQLRVIIRSFVKEEFDRIVELTEIRYKELDRVTRHGKEPAPKTGQLADWLRVGG